MNQEYKSNNKNRLDYQQRYVKVSERYYKSLSEPFNEFSQGRFKGKVLEMQWVLRNIFGLSERQIYEVERNQGFTNDDIECP